MLVASSIIVRLPSENGETHATENHELFVIMCHTVCKKTINAFLFMKLSSIASIEDKHVFEFLYALVMIDRL